MSEKTRQKKDGQDKNKKNHRMRQVTQKPDKDNRAAARQTRTASGQGKQSRNRRAE